MKTCGTGQQNGDLWYRATEWRLVVQGNIMKTCGTVQHNED